MFKFLKAGFQGIKKALKKTSQVFTNKLLGFFSKPIDEERLEEFEELLYEADLGSAVVSEWLEIVKSLAAKKAPSQEIIKALEDSALATLNTSTEITGSEPLIGEPEVILMTGVNGSGKTTSIAKLARLLQSEGKKVLLAAGDTFRAAAGEQLQKWATKLNIDVVASTPGADPSSVLFDAMQKGKAKGYDVVICDTAGRLETRSELMQELEKMVRVAKKVSPEAPHQTYLTVDASLGQTVIEQAKIFSKFAPLTGIVLTKLDGSTKGGVALAIYKELKIPIRFVGTGEKVDDFAPFEAESYAKALFEA